MIVATNLLHQVAETEPQVGGDVHHALVVDRRIADLRDHVPFLQRIRRGIVIGLMYDNARHRLVELQEAAQRRILQRLQLVEECRFAVIVTVGNILQEDLDFLIGNDVSDILRIAQSR